MRDDTRQMLEKYSKVHKQKSLWYKVVTCLAAVVVFCTTYALILPAITMEKTPTCGLEEHVHTEECYQRELNCELEVHEHTTACYDMEGNVICGYADYVAHSHNEFCYDDEGVLVCELPEIEAHEHNEDCLLLRRQSCRIQELHREIRQQGTVRQRAQHLQKKRRQRRQKRVL